MGLLSFLKRKPDEQKNYSFSNYAFFVNNNGVLIPDTATLNVQLLIQHYQTVNPLGSAVDKLANTIGMLPIALKNKSNDEMIYQHAVLDLLNHPNDEEQKTRKDFLRDIAIWKILEGNAYINLTSPKTERPGARQLYVLKPQYFTIKPDSKGYPISYVYSSGTINETFTKQVSLGRFRNGDESGELLHIRNFNPNYSSGDLKGTSEITKLFFEIMQYLESSNHNLRLLMNGARPSGALIVENKDGSKLTLNDAEYQRLKAMIQENYTGSNNSGKPLLLEGGLKWQEMSLSPKDMDFATLKKSAEQQIYNGLGIPLELMMPDGTTFNNKAEAKMSFYEDRVIPFAEDILDGLNPWLLPLFKGTENLELVVDKKKVDALSAKWDQRNKTISDDTVMTINEKRAEKGLPPVPGGDKIITSTGFAVAGTDAGDSSTQTNPTDIPGENLDTQKKSPILGKQETRFILESSLLSTLNEIDGEDIVLTTTPIVAEMYGRLIGEFGKDQVDEIGRNLAFDETQRVKDFIQKESGNFITKINETTRARIKNQIQISANNQEGPDVLALRIREEFKGFKESRAESIAVTETTRAFGFAAREAMTQADIYRAVWMTTKDGRARDAHKRLDGKLSEDDGLFHMDGDSAPYPGGFRSASMNIRCRCAIRAYFDDEKAHGMTEQQETALWHRREEVRQSKEGIVINSMKKIFTLQEEKFFKVFDELTKNFR